MGSVRRPVHPGMHGARGQGSPPAPALAGHERRPADDASPLRPGVHEQEAGTPVRDMNAHPRRPTCPLSRGGSAARQIAAPPSGWPPTGPGARCSSRHFHESAWGRPRLPERTANVIPGLIVEHRAPSSVGRCLRRRSPPAAPPSTGTAPPGLRTAHHGPLRAPGDRVRQGST